MIYSEGFFHWLLVTVPFFIALEFIVGGLLIVLSNFIEYVFCPSLLKESPSYKTFTDRSYFFKIVTVCVFVLILAASVYYNLGFPEDKRVMLTGPFPKFWELFSFIPLHFY